MKLWEDNDRREVYFEQQEGVDRETEKTLEGLLSVAVGAVVQLFRMGRVDLLRDLVESIPHSEFDDAVERQRYIESFLAGEESPVRVATLLLYRRLTEETFGYRSFDNVPGEARYVTVERVKNPKPQAPKKIRSGLRGVGLHRGRWRAEVSQVIHGVYYKKYLGSFDTKTGAAAIHDNWVRQHIGAEGKLSTDAVYQPSSRTTSPTTE